MTKSLYDPEVEKKGIEQGIMVNKIENTKNLLDIFDDETIAVKIGLDLDTVKKLIKESLG